MELKNLKTKFLAHKIFYYKQIDSTQKEIWRRIDTNIENGTLVIAETQTDGIGTHGRKWYTEFPNNIAFSCYIKCNCKIEKLEGITNEIAQIMQEVFYKTYNIKLDIKEPNDLYYNNKKIGGILTESKVLKDKVRFLIIGIGVNTSQTKFNEELFNIATSIKKEFDIDVNTQEIITQFCNEFEKAFLERVKK